MTLVRPRSARSFVALVAMFACAARPATADTPGVISLPFVPPATWQRVAPADLPPAPLSWSNGESTFSIAHLRAGLNFTISDMAGALSTATPQSGATAKRTSLTICSESAERIEIDRADGFKSITQLQNIDGAIEVTDYARPPGTAIDPPILQTMDSYCGRGSDVRLAPPSGWTAHHRSIVGVWLHAGDTLTATVDRTTPGGIGDVQNFVDGDIAGSARVRVVSKRTGKLCGLPAVFASFETPIGNGLSIDSTSEATVSTDAGYTLLYQHSTAHPPDPIAIKTLASLCGTTSYAVAQATSSPETATPEPFTPPPVPTRGPATAAPATPMPTTPVPATPVPATPAPVKPHATPRPAPTFAPPTATPATPAPARVVASVAVPPYVPPSIWKSAIEAEPTPAVDWRSDRGKLKISRIDNPVDLRHYGSAFAAVVSQLGSVESTVTLSDCGKLAIRSVIDAPGVGSTITEQVESFGDGTFLSTYTRPIGTRADIALERSLTSFCGTHAGGAFNPPPGWHRSRFRVLGEWYAGSAELVETATDPLPTIAQHVDRIVAEARPRLTLVAHSITTGTLCGNPAVYFSLSGSSEAGSVEVTGIVTQSPLEALVLTYERAGDTAADSETLNSFGTVCESAAR